MNITTCHKWTVWSDCGMCYILV